MQTARTARGRVIVLVEGRSDVAALGSLSRSWGVELELVPMGGATNVRRYARRQRGTGGPLLGLCDLKEQRFFARVVPALDEVFVCDRDLEDELIRAVGAAAVVDVLAELHELERFRTFQRQPEWRGRPLHDQLRRFAGTRSGRKARLAGALADRLVPATTPEVLGRLLRRCDDARAR